MAKDSPEYAGVRRNSTAEEEDTTPTQQTRCFIFRKIQYYIVWICIYSFLSGFTVNGLVNISIPQIEKRYGLPSALSGVIASSNDIGSLAVVLFVSYFGSRQSKPRWVAAGAVIMALGSLLFMLPQFVSGNYQYPEIANKSESLCVGNGSQIIHPSCDSGGYAGMSVYLGVFMLGQILHGIGFIPSLTLGTAYIYDNEPMGNAAQHIGFAYAASALGVATGFLTGGQFLKFFVDFNKVDADSISLSPGDVRWVGAWWIGFTIPVVGLILIAIPIFQYPAAFPKKVSDETTECIKGPTSAPKPTDNLLLCQYIVRFFKTTINLVTNPVFMFVSLGGCMGTLIISGIGAFSAKYLMEQYNLLPSTSGIIIGCLIIFGSAGGMGVGGVLIRTLKLDVPGMTRLCACCFILSAVVGLGYLAKCPEVNIAGLNTPYPGEMTINGYDNATCLSDCACDGMKFQPVCGADVRVYYSPCHAGCDIISKNVSIVYQNCSCVAVGLYEHSEDTLDISVNATAVSGRCPQDCDMLYVMIPCLFIMMFPVFLSTTPTSMATLRCVQANTGSFALGLQWTMFKLFGMIPGPVIVGLVLDRACAIWSQECDGGKSCLMYNKTRLSQGIVVWSSIINVAAAIMYSISSMCCKKQTPTRNEQE